MASKSSAIDQLPLTVLVGDPAESGLEIYDTNAALHVAVVERHQINSLKDTIWNMPGAYILLDRPDSATGVWGVYAGKAPQGVKNRVRQHVHNKDHWYRAVLLRRDTTHGFNSAEVGWLEGRVYDLLDAAEFAELHNGNRPSDETLPAFTRNSLENMVPTISRILTMLGHDPAPADTDQAPTKAIVNTQTTRYVGITVLDLITAGLLQPGPIVSTSAIWPGEATLNTDGTINVNGVNYPSPSAAGCAHYKALGGPKTVNGWSLWAITTDTGLVKLSTLRERYLDKD